MSNISCLDCVAALKAARVKQIEKWVHERKEDGRWVVAQWDGRACQWTWHERPAPKHVQGYCYSFARTLKGVSRHYSSRSGAVASLPALRPSEHRCSSCENDVLAACEAEDRAYRERTRAQDEAEARFEALEAQRRHEAEEAALEEELEARDRREAEILASEHAAAAAEAQAACDRATARFWSRVEVGASVPSSKDLVIVSVDRDGRRLVARSPKGTERLYTAFASETGTVSLAVMAQ